MGLSLESGGPAQRRNPARKFNFLILNSKSRNKPGTPYPEDTMSVWKFLLGFVVIVIPVAPVRSLHSEDRMDGGLAG